MGPWPWYIVATCALALAMLLALAAIARGVQRLDRRGRTVAVDALA